MSADYTFTDRANSPYRVPRDENALQAAVEQVAFTHFSGVSPEFVEWYREQDYAIETAFIVSNLVCGDAADKAEARRLAVRVQDDFTQWVAAVAAVVDSDCWPLARQIYREVRKC